MASKTEKAQAATQAKFEAQVKKAEESAEHRTMEAQRRELGAAGWYYDWAREDFDVDADGNPCHDGWYAAWVMEIECEGYPTCEIEAWDYQDAVSDRTQKYIARALRQKSMIESGVLIPSNTQWWHDPVSANYFHNLKVNGEI